jgi:hypothetical protein
VVERPARDQVAQHLVVEAVRVEGPRRTLTVKLGELPVLDQHVARHPAFSRVDGLFDIEPEVALEHQPIRNKRILHSVQHVAQVIVDRLSSIKLAVAASVVVSPAVVDV